MSAAIAIIAGTRLTSNAAVAGGPTSLTVVVVAFVFVFIVMANGVHGSLRDLANDLTCGVRSTAIMMGVRPQGATGLFIPRRLTWYALTLQVILIGIRLREGPAPRMSRRARPRRRGHCQWVTCPAEF